jgi:DNA-binding response OmpR family regulator
MRADEKPKVKRILLVDDDIDLLMLLERKLQKSGYIIESAASMPEAEYVLSLFKPHIVILDINVAGDDGRQLCWKIKNTGDNRQAKVILMSGYNYPINRQLLFGADDYLAKPFQGEYLLNKIETLLNDETAIAPAIVLPPPAMINVSSGLNS